MRYIRFLCALFAVALLALPAWAANTCAGVQVGPHDRYAASNVRLRAWQSTYSTAYTTLPRGQRVVQQGVAAEWTHVYVPSLQMTGYVATRFLTPNCVAGRQIARADLRTKEVVDILINDSMARYGGPCPCPYNTDRAGRRCGLRSAYTRPGGAAPLCYPGDVPKELVEHFREGA